MIMKTPDDRLVKIADVLELLKPHFHPESLPAAATIRRWIDAGILPGMYVGGQRYAYESGVRRFINKIGDERRHFEDELD